MIQEIFDEYIERWLDSLEQTGLVITGNYFFNNIETEGTITAADIDNDKSVVYFTMDYSGKLKWQKIRFKDTVPQNCYQAFKNKPNLSECYMQYATWPENGLINAKEMFAGPNALSSGNNFKLTGILFAENADATSMFEGANIYGMPTDLVTNNGNAPKIMDKMFKNTYCRQMDFSGWNFDNTTSMAEMFYGITSYLASVYIPPAKNCTSYAGLFYDCQYLSSLGNTVFDLHSIASTAAVQNMFYNCQALGSSGVTLKFKDVNRNVFANEAALRTAASIPSGCIVEIQNFI